MRTGAGIFAVLAGIMLALGGIKFAFGRQMVQNPSEEIREWGKAYLQNVRYYVAVAASFLLLALVFLLLSL